MTPDGGRRRAFDLVVSDVDGTLIDADKRLTERTVAAVRGLREAGVAFAVTSARPPLGLRHIVEPLGVTTPVGGFNGGHVVEPPGFGTVASHPLDPGVARHVAAHLEARGVQVWIFDGEEWFLKDPDAPHVERESGTLRFRPTVVGGFDDHLSAVGKLVGVSDDHAHLAAVEADLRRRLGRVSVSRSQPYYLDVTDCDANKGVFVRVVCERLGVDPARVLAIGDGGNDVAMFAEAGLGVAMGQASAEVRDAAGEITATNLEDGFARAVETHVIGVTA